MFKQSIIYLIISILLIVLKSYVALGLAYFNYFYKWFAGIGAPLLQQLGFGAQLQTILLLVLFPVLIVGIPGSVYYMVKRKKMPYLMEATWALWVVIVLCHVLIP